MHTFMISGWIEISSPSFQGRERKREGSPHGRDRDVYKLPNCVPIARRRLAEYEPALRHLLVQIARFKPRVGRAAARSPLLVELEEVDGLVAAGVLSQQEHSRIRALLLGFGSELPSSPTTDPDS